MQSWHSILGYFMNIIKYNVLCYLEGRVEAGDVEKLIETFKHMTAEQPRNKIMEMLQIDDWQNFPK